MSKARQLADLGNVYDDGALSNRNLIINGAMQVAQRGTSSTASGYGSVDRWLNTFSGVSLTQSQQSLTSGEPFEAGFRNYLRLTQSSSSSAASDYAQMSHRVEGLNAATSGWHYKSSTSYITASFWVRSSLAGTYYVYMQTRSDSGDGYINAPFTISANTWTKVVISFAGNSSLNIDNDNTSGIEFRIVPYYGTNFTSSSLPSNTWYFSTGGGELPDFAQNWCASSGATFDITGVQLEAGDTATPFEHRSYGDELARCQRYCLVYSPVYYQRFPVFGNGTAAFLWYPEFPVEMRASPSLIQKSLSSSTIQVYNYTADGTRSFSSAALAEGGILGSQVTIAVSSGSGIGHVGSWRWVGTPDAYIGFDAEL